MKEEKKKFEMPLKHETITGTFTDYRGMERDFTMVAVTIPVKEKDIDIVVYSREHITDPTYNVTYSIDSEYKKYPEDESNEGYESFVFTDLTKVRKILSIGVAVRCNRDKDLKLGEYIAYGKAFRNAFETYGHVLFVTHSGMINTKMVQALLEQESEHFKKDPGSYIKGYNKDRDRYLSTGRVAIAEMTEQEFNEFQQTNNVTVTEKPKKEYKGVSITNVTKPAAKPQITVVEQENHFEGNTDSTQEEPEEVVENENGNKDTAPILSASSTPVNKSKYMRLKMSK